MFGIQTDSHRLLQGIFLKNTTGSIGLSCLVCLLWSRNQNGLKVESDLYMFIVFGNSILFKIWADHMCKTISYVDDFSIFSLPEAQDCYWYMNCLKRMKEAIKTLKTLSFVVSANNTDLVLFSSFRRVIDKQHLVLLRTQLLLSGLLFVWKYFKRRWTGRFM